MPPLTPALLFASVIVACWIAPTSSFVIRLQGAILGSGGSCTIWFVGLLCAGVGDTLVLRWSLLHPTQTRTTSNGKTRNMADKPISIVRCLQTETAASLQKRPLIFTPRRRAAALISVS